jgi:hypothetical protein
LLPELCNETVTIAVSDLPTLQRLIRLNKL